MTEEQRRLMHARQKVEAFFVNPIKELLDATAALVAAEKTRADQAWRAGYSAGQKALVGGLDQELSGD